MELDFLATVLLSSLSSASILLIATLGLAVVYGLMGVINLAHCHCALNSWTRTCSRRKFRFLCP
nr:hypothetical protein [uncultured Ruegeria sp.]